MHMPIIISKLSNFLFFIQKTNDYNWVKFNFKKYLSGENFNLCFYGESENKIWRQTEKVVGEENAKQIKKDIVLLKPIFASRWRKASEHLLLWKRYFQNNRLLLQRAVLEIKKLSGIKHFEISKIPIYLISDPVSNDKEINAWFSWTPKESFIVVEIPISLKAPDNFFPLAVLAHEFFHLMLRKNKNLFSKISKIAKENDKLFAELAEGIPNRIFMEELLISSFIPEGYLSKKYFNTKVFSRTSRPHNLSMWRKLIASKLCQTAKRYINSAQQINEEYLKDLIGIIKHTTK